MYRQSFQLFGVVVGRVKSCFTGLIGILALVLVMPFYGFGQQASSDSSAAKPAATAATSDPEGSGPKADKAGPDFLYPNAEANPGFTNPKITQDNIADTICRKGWSTKSIRPPASLTSKLKLKQMPDYDDTVHQTNSKLHYDPQKRKIRESSCDPHSDNPRCFEEDHIISLENGGNPSDPKNLWPEPYNTKVDGKRIGAHEKDQVENYVHNGICLDVPNAKFSMGPKPPHSLTLKEGQAILANDWYACYLKMKAGEDCK